MADWMAENPYRKEAQDVEDACIARGITKWRGEAGAMETAFARGCEAQACKLMAWGNEMCDGHETPSGRFRDLREIPRRMCTVCWEKFEREVMG